jgi:hypothetical protein
LLPRAPRDSRQAVHAGRGIRHAQDYSFGEHVSF